MQVKTITCHQVYNHGASLQQYALLYFLNQNGFEAETINYRPAYLSNHFNFLHVSNPRFEKPLLKQLYLLAKLPGRLVDLKRKKAFDAFEKKYIPVHRIKYASNEELKSNLPKADAYICGSDQIWNSYFQNGKDPAFYLDFVPSNKLKVAYAASFATDTIASELKNFVKDKVSRIDRISVRETSALKILEDLRIDNAIRVLDPVFLVDKTHWLQFVNAYSEKFVFVYDFDNDPLLKKMVLEYKSINRVQIYTINKSINYADKNFYLEGPETFLSLMHGAEFIFTNSFHSVVFSLLFEKQFVVFNRKEEINTRSRDLLELFNLKNLTTKPIGVAALEQVDYLKFGPMLQKEIEKSKGFLLELKLHTCEK